MSTTTRLGFLPSDSTLMTKAELIARIARCRELPPDVTKKVVAEVLDLAFAELGQYFVRGKLTRNTSPRFTFPKFGTFTKKKRNARRGVNPRTLEPMEIEASDTIDFKPSVELKRQLNEGTVAKAKQVATKPRTAKSAAAKRSGSRPESEAVPRATRPRGLGGRKLATREDADVAEATRSASRLPDAPLQKVRRKPAATAKPKPRRRAG